MSRIRSADAGRSGTIVLGEGHWGGISQLHHHLATGEDCFKSFSGGLNFWEYLALPEHAEEAEHFNKYMVVCELVTVAPVSHDGSKPVSLY